MFDRACMGVSDLAKSQVRRWPHNQNKIVLLKKQWTQAHQQLILEHGLNPRQQWLMKTTNSYDLIQLDAQLDGDRIKAKADPTIRLDVFNLSIWMILSFMKIRMKV